MPVASSGESGSGTLARVERAPGPAQRGAGAAPPRRARSTLAAARPDQQHQPDEAEQPGRPPRRGPGRLPPWRSQSKQHHPERHGRDQQRREPGVHAAAPPTPRRRCRPSSSSAADQRRRAPVDAARPRRAAPARPAVEQRAGDQEAHAGHQERRQRLDREADRQIGRSPDHVDGAQRQRQLAAGRAKRPVSRQPWSTSSSSPPATRRAVAAAGEPALAERLEHDGGAGATDRPRRRTARAAAGRAPWRRRRAP